MAVDDVIKFVKRHDMRDVLLLIYQTYAGMMITPQEI